MPPPRHRPNGADDHGFRRELDGLRHALELADGEVDVVPLFFLHAHEQQHEVGADGKIRGVVGDDEGVEVVAGAAGFQGLNDQADDVGAQRVHLAVELDAGYAIAEIDQRGAGIFLDDAVGFFCDCRPTRRRRELDRLPAFGSQFPVLAA